MAERWTNWAGTESAEVEVATPTTVGQVQQAVTSAERVKPIGSGHSFTGIGVTDGLHLRLDGLTGIVRADSASGLVTVAAGTRLHELNRTLWDLGLSMTNLGDIDVQTISGAISTGTHGTGAEFGGIATQVRALEMVLANGDVITASPTEHPDVFAAAQVGLGALGVITAVTLQCEPRFALAAQEQPATLDQVLADLDESVGTNDHFEFYWFPHTRRCLTKRNNRVLPGAKLRPLPRLRYWLDDEFLSNTVFEGLNRVTTRRPSLIPRVNQVAARALSARGYVDRSYAVFASPRRVRFKEMEYAIPRDAVPGVLAAIEAWLCRTGERIGFPVEVRFAAADDLWLSTASGRDSAYVAVHTYWNRPHEAYFRAVEQICTDVDGRPHWGKIHFTSADYLREQYEHFDEFLEVRDRLDPDRRFTNAYLERVLG